MLKFVKKESAKSASRKTARKQAIYRRALLGFGLSLAAAGAYLLILVISPAVYAPQESKETTLPQEPATVENRLFIPKLGVSIPYQTGGPAVLNENAWHRYPERGDPEKGGNFILSAHRFRLGLTPGATRRRSPFYHIDKLAKGDAIYVDFAGKRYRYEVTDRFSVKPSQTEIENPSVEPKMTLYSCTLKGEHDGREVIIARLVESNVDPTRSL